MMKSASDPPAHARARTHARAEYENTSKKKKSERAESPNIYSLIVAAANTLFWQLRAI